MTLTIAYSPCPNDTFIFDALVHGRIDTEGLRFKPVLADVEALNQAAFAKTYAVSKLSFAALAHLQRDYRLLDAGSALGDGIGPLLIAKSDLDPAALRDEPIAIPGRYTTAAFLLRLAYPQLSNLRETLFSDIEASIERGEVVAGVIIHETRFTYADRGFVKLRDLGSFWEETTQLPIPLGGIGVRRDLPIDIQEKLGRVLARSVAYAFAHPEASAAYVAAHAQEMSPTIQRQHIQTYVTHFSQSLGARGRQAVEVMLDLAHERGLVADRASDFFV